jgi:transposase
MNTKDRKRFTILTRVKDGLIDQVKAAKDLKLSYRQIQRIYAKFLKEGEKSILHGLRGKQSNNQSDKSIKTSALEIFKEKYSDFKPTFASEKLEEEYGLKINPETLRLWLLKEGLWVKSRKTAKHRSRRDRKRHFGELLQIDGSPHDWFEGRRAKCCLMNLIDDATGITMGVFAEEESTRVAFEVLRMWITRFGIPQVIYCDHHTIYVTDREINIEEQLAGKKALTEFGRTCDELGIQIIPAGSPQAKGRVERKHGIDQDRLVKELRLIKASSIKEANMFLQKIYLDKMNKKFSRPAVEKEDFHVNLLPDQNLDSILCWKTERILSFDWVISYENRKFQIPQKYVSILGPKKKIIVSKWMDDSIHLTYKKQEIEFKEIAAYNESARQVS